MKVLKLERIVKTYYDALEEGKVLGRKCPACGHIEFPPYLACNECGNLDTEWVDLTNVRAHVRQMLHPLNVFPEREFKEKHGGYIPIAVQIENGDPYNTSLIHVDDSRYDELHDNLENVIVKPCIVQDEDTKICLWVLEDWEPDAEEECVETIEEVTNPEGESEKTSETGKTVSSKLAEIVIACAAEAYGMDASEITLASDVRKDLGNESLKMIVMLSEITERTDVPIDITEAGAFNTIGDFVEAVQAKCEPGRFGDDTVIATEKEQTANGVESQKTANSEELDDLTKIVIAAAAEAYGMNASEITLASDVRKDLGNESLKMIVMLSEITERTDVPIDITEAGAFNTIGDFVNAVKEKMSK